MSYKNPLRIFEPSEISELTMASLPSFRKRLLLLFQFAEGPTIIVNGHEIDRNELNNIFETLTDRLSFYKAIYNNKPLRIFLDTGSLKDFPVGLDGSLMDQTINEIVCRRINESLFICIQSKSYVSADFNCFLEYLTTVDSSLEDIAYRNLYPLIESHIKSLYGVHKAQISSGLIFGQDVGRDVDEEFFLKVRSLPRTFYALEKLYAEWVAEYVLNPAVLTRKEFHKFPTESLEILERAYRIWFLHSRKESLQEKIATIQSILGARPYVHIRFSAVLFLVIFFVLGGLKFLSYISNMPSSLEKVPERTGIVLFDSLSIWPNTILSSDDPLLDVNHIDSTTNIYAVIDGIPNDLSDFDQILPDSVKSEFSEGSRNVIFTLRFRKYPNLIVRHQLLLKGGKIKSYVFPQNKHDVSVDFERYSNSLITLSTCISSYDSLSNQFDSSYTIRLSGARDMHFAPSSVLRIIGSKNPISNRDMIFGASMEQDPNKKALKRTYGFLVGFLSRNFICLEKRTYRNDRRYFLRGLTIVNPGSKGYGLNYSIAKDGVGIFEEVLRSNVDEYATARVDGDDFKIVYLFSSLTQRVVAMDCLYKVDGKVIKFSAFLD